MTNTDQTFLYEAHNYVLDFWKAFRLPYAKTWIDSSSKARDLSAKLMKEEFDELMNASTEEEKLDSYCDLLYVTLGGMHSLGYGRSYLVVRNPPANFTGPLAESIKLIQEKGIICHRRLTEALPETCWGITLTAKAKYSKFPAAFRAVHSANMSKLWRELPDPSIISTVTVEETERGRYLVKRKEDGKVMKAPTFKHPELTKYL